MIPSGGGEASFCFAVSGKVFLGSFAPIIDFDADCFSDLTEDGGDVLDLVDVLFLLSASDLFSPASLIVDGEADFRLLRTNCCFASGFIFSDKCRLS